MPQKRTMDTTTSTVNREAVKKARRRRGNKKSKDSNGKDHHSNGKDQHSNGHSNRKDQPEQMKSTPPSNPVKTTKVVQAPSSENRHQFSETAFSSLSSIRQETQRALKEVLHYEYMTNVQNKTLPHILKGNDILAKAKTGSGKTTAFLLPILEGIKQKNGVQAVVISPTRELTVQIATEAAALATFLPSVKIVTLIGGTNINKDAGRLNGTVHLIVATPGRLLDHLKSNTKNVVDRLSDLKCLCLDEADTLLDMGFRPDLERILSYMPEDRQTLLFSATLPKQLDAITKIAMKKDHIYVNTITKGEDATNVQVQQEYTIVPLEDISATLESVLREHQATNQDYKIMVFFNTARTAGYMSSLFLAADFPIKEMHSRKAQNYRTRVAAEFTKESNVIMFSSDVSARGVDYPGVTLIVQVGLTTKEQYIHRLGRTARAGRQGSGIILLADFEEVFIDSLKGLPLTNRPALPGINANSSTPICNLIPTIVDNPTILRPAEQAYQSFLGFYNSNLKLLGMNKSQLVTLANQYSDIIGCPSPPTLDARTIGKMGLKGQPGLIPAKKANGNGEKQRTDRNRPVKKKTEENGRDRNYRSMKSY